VTVSRILPATLSRRFSDAPRATCKVESASFEVVVAQRFLLRLRGLAGVDEFRLVPLLFPRCRSLHTFGMRAPIDVVWLELGSDGHGEVREVEPAVAPRHMVRAPRGSDRRRIAALELASGDAVALGLRAGTRVVISAEG
jgi:uncharacterized membrane protein (UPF0127 family)